MQDAEGRRSYPLGTDASGYLMYTSSGLMSATLMRQGRPALGIPSEHARELRAKLIGEGHDVITARDHPLLARYFLAADGYLTYCGRFEIHGSTVVHRVEQSLYPEWVGIEQVRRFEFDGDALLLTAEAGTLTACLAWRRVK